jgi:hypothetical protein
MIRKSGINLLLFLCKPLLIAFLIVGVFGLVYLRSSFVKLEYSLGDLEKKKMNCLKERKMLLAEKTKLLSYAKLEASPSDGEGFSLPDRRMKVVYLTKQKNTLPYKASLERSQLAEP